MLFVGAFTIVFVIFLFWREYTSYLRRELLVLRTFRNMLRDMKDKMRCYLDSPRSWSLGYENDILSDSGFLGALRGGADLLEAYVTCREKLCISQETDSVLFSLFSRAGEGYIDTELEAMECALEGLSAIESTMVDEVNKKTKVSGAVLGAFAAGIIILVM